jgi:hypothetical protein
MPVGKIRGALVVIGFGIGDHANVSALEKN